MKNILICQPPMYQGTTWLPYVYGTLRTVAEQDEEVKQNYNWLSPLFRQVDTIKDFTDQYDPKDIDVLGISCYEWNHIINFKIAEYVKLHNPNCLIVAGGPQPPWRDDKVFDTYPYIDIIIKGDGEVPFSSILKNLVNNRSNDLVPGLIINNQGVAQRTAKEVPYKFDIGPSPYIHLSKQFEEFAAYPEPSFATLETNKGCPYKCTFCDWGSATNQKIRKVGKDRVYEEIEWFGKNGIEMIYITDANFGILPEDVNIAKALVETKEKYGFPRTVFYNLAKNNDDRIVDILKMFNDANMTNNTIMINFQSTLDNVLDAMERFNAPFPKIKNMVRRLIDVNIAPGSALIQGAPLETVDSWKKSVTDVYELGIHEETRIFIWQQLPNAPATDPEYIEKYKLQAVDRVPVMNRFNKDLLPKIGRLGLSSYLVESSSYTRDDWAEMGVFSAFTLMCHNFGFTRYIAQYHKHSLGIPYFDFYNTLYDKFKTTEHYSKLKDHLYKFAAQDGSTFNIDYDDSLPWLLDPEEYLFLSVSEDQELFYHTMFSDVTDAELLDLISFQQQSMITVKSKNPKDVIFTMNQDWVAYFRYLKSSYYEIEDYKPAQTKRKYQCITSHYNNIFDNLSLKDYCVKILKRKAGRQDYTLISFEKFKDVTNDTN